MPYQPFHAQWLMAIAAAFGLAFMLAIGAAGCTPDETPMASEESTDVSGSELPEVDVDPIDPEVAPRVGRADR